MAGKIAYLRNDFMAITSNVYCAILLDCLVRATNEGKKEAILTFEELAGMSMIKKSNVSVGRYIDKLIDMGYVAYKMCHGLRAYTVSVKNIKSALIASGFDDELGIIVL